MGKCLFSSDFGVVFLVFLTFLFLFIRELGQKFFLDSPIDTRSATFVSVVRLHFIFFFKCAEGLAWGMQAYEGSF